MLHIQSGLGPLKLQAVTFDVDSTLYSYRTVLPTRIISIIKHPRMLPLFFRMRKAIRREGYHSNFYDFQVRFFSRYSGVSREKAGDFIDSVVYGGWNSDTRGMKAFTGVREFIEHCIDMGLDIGIITDFPIGQKLDALGLSDLPWKAIIESEVTGELKPSVYPFRKALSTLGLTDEPGAVLHIGDNIRYDVAGARNVGMRTAWFVEGILGAFISSMQERKVGIHPDITFNNWIELTEGIDELTSTGKLE